MDDIVSFLLSARLNGYGSQKAKSKPTEEGSNDFSFISDPLRYHDRYFDDEAFMGEETIWRGEDPVWGMNYYGHLEKEAERKEIFGFLKECLQHGASNGAFPRGIVNYTKDELHYRVICEDNYERFQGHESIYENGERRYQAYFHGGLIIGKE